MPWNRCSISVLTILTGLGLMVNGSVQAQAVFKCTDRQGHVAFQATRCGAGLVEQIVEIAAVPTPAPSPDYASPQRPKRTGLRLVRSTQRVAEETSFECRTAAGALFYRHDGCPTVVGRGNPKSDLHASRGETVRARRIPRSKACRGLRTLGRRGQENDEVTPTYDKNLGRDPCRKY